MELILRIFSVPSEIACESPRLQNGSLHIWAWDLAAEPEDPSCLEALLSTDERTCLARFHFAADRSRFLLTRSRLRRILGGYLHTPPATLRFLYAEYGKPSLAPEYGNLQFNVSHTKELAVLAITAASPVGIDIENIRPIDLSTGDQVFSPGEKDCLRALPADRRAAAFFQCWTRKEAVCKAEGLGLSMETYRFSVYPRPASGEWLRRTEGVLSRDWLLLDLPLQGSIIGSVAVGAQPSEIRFFT